MGDKTDLRRRKQTGFYRVYDSFFYYLDLLRKKILTQWDDFLFALTRFFGPIVGKSFKSLANFMAFTLKQDEPNRAWMIVPKILFGTAIAIPLFLIAFTGIMVGGMFATIFGMRNLGEYTFKEELIAWAPLILLFLSVPLWASPYILGKVSLILCFSVLLIGFDFLYGQCGILSLGHAGFAYLGAFFAAFLYNGTFVWQVPFFIAALLSSFAVFCVGFLLGLPSLRVKDQYLFVVTLAFGISVAHIFRSQYLSQYSGVDMGGLSIDQPGFFDFIRHVDGSIQNYLFILISTACLIFFAHNIIRRSQIGRAFHVIKCDDEVSSILGVSLLRYKLLAFSLSAFYAAYAGCMIMLLARYVATDSYTIFEAIDYYVAIVIGGLGSIFGAVIGAAFLTFEVDITHYFAELIPRGQFLARVFFGILLIVIIYLSPNGKGLADLISSFFKSRLAQPIRRGMHYMFPPPDYSSSENRNPPIKDK